MATKDDAAEKLRRDETRLLEKLKEMVIKESELTEKTFLEEQENKRYSNWFRTKYESTEQDKIMFEEIRNWFEKARSILDARLIRAQRRDLICEIVLYDDPRITARVQTSMDNQLDIIKAEPLSNMDRTELLFGQTHSLLSGMQYISDIYRITGGFKFNAPCRVSIQLKMKYNEKISDLKAVVRDSGTWTEIPATLENGHAVFELRSMDCVYVVTVPKTTKAEVTENGYEYSSDADDRVCFRIPANAVNKPTTISIKVMPPDGEVMKKVQQSRDKYDILAMSHCLCVEYKDSDKFKKKVTITLPLIQPPNTRDYETLLLTLGEDSVSKVRTAIRAGDRDTVSSEMHSPKMQLYVLAKKTSNVKLLHDEVLLNLGLARYYKVLSFRDSKDLRALLIECTPMEKVQQVINKRKKEGYVLERNGGQSNPLLLRQEQRLRMDLTENIEKDISIPQVAYFITVLFGAEDIKAFFPYKIKGTVGGSHFGNLTISSDNFKRRTLCSMHFDPMFLTGK
ncbi:hypothetical protein CHS0354_028893 [Potamilus streckersoni]|uniref:Uncharacterized protein n=1 Tax=Potamilus streckersoni TaxID=2493646 RepID=A0AAE0SC96_9BIVA|nr:hypothetical protein CHS0354_028893 [Potamilus streckersoni]